MTALLGDRGRLRASRRQAVWNLWAWAVYIERVYGVWLIEDGDPSPSRTQ